MLRFPPDGRTDMATTGRHPDGFKIESVYAWVHTEEDGTEGVPAFQDPAGGFMMPLIAADPDRLVSLRPIAEGIVANTGKPLVLAKFSVREDVETIGG